MTIYFHESLPTLVMSAVLAGVSFDVGTVIIRDGAGRLTLAVADWDSPVALEEVLRKDLGGYLKSPGVISGSLARRLIEDPAKRTVPVHLETGTVFVRFIDRRVIGADWLLSPSSKSTSASRRLVFGSLKGGVGRSTALTVLAAELARRGKKVLTVDLDLEAPGIGTMLLPASADPAIDRRPRFGVVDYLIENGINGVEDTDLYDFIGVSPFHQGSIDVFPAVGRETDARPHQMIPKLSRALVEDQSEVGPVPLVAQIATMIERFEARGQYEVTLIDARAGMAEVSAAPLVGLGAEVLLFGADQPQTFQGFAFILSNLIANTAPEVLAGNDDWRQSLTFVQSKASGARSKRATFRERLYELCAQHLYDAETAEESAHPLEIFSPAPNETGPGVPHDATHIEYHPDYDAFDPLGDGAQLEEDLYRGPFGSFIERCMMLLGYSETMQ